ncbi:protein C10 [Schistocerca cancellata]|uniref:protein C10 n=1 Tax=Schistocerca cancellata TaxID=274614 RepID=UPI0021190876|nr:protein C10 [Schistocerca cancellata]
MEIIMASAPITNSFQFTAEKARVALSNVLEALDSPENSVKLGEAKDNAGNDMLKMMQYVFPIVLQIQMDVIKNYGFQEGREGIVQFVQLIRTLEKEDPEVAHLHAQIRAHYLPPVSISTESS